MKNNKDTFLVLSHDANMWTSSKNRIFLSRACFKGSAYKKDLEDIVDITINRNFNNDYKCLKSTYEKLLSQISLELNEIHNVNFSVREWAISIGPWLAFFVWKYSYAYYQLKYISSNKLAQCTLIRKSEEFKWVPFDTREFRAMAYTDEWMVHIYSSILAKTKMIEYSEVACQDEDFVGLTKPRFIKTIHFMHLKYLRLIRLLKNQLVIADVQLGFFQKIIFSVKCRSVPFFKFPWVYKSVLNEARVNTSLRNRSVLLNSEDELEELIASEIYQNIPKVFLESYNDVVLYSDFYLPKKPLRILSTTSHFDNDLFKIWTSRCVNNGAKLLIHQHGGLYGIGSYSYEEEHEIFISDKYYTYGWGESENKKIKAMPSIKLSNGISKMPCKYKDGVIKLVVTLSELYHNGKGMRAIFPHQNDYSEYLYDVSNFVNLLSKEARSILSCRRFDRDYSWGVEKFIKEEEMGFLFNEAETNMSFIQSVKKSRLVINTTNTTTFLETLSMNHPTVVYLNPKYWPIRDNAVPFIEALVESKIVFYDIVDLAKHVNDVFTDVDKWWLDQKTQDGVNFFVDEFARTDYNWKDLWSNEIKV
jgi:putative transferase (TIGR04331 family)